MVKPVQGDIYWVRFGKSGDSGPSGKRPAIVIQNDTLNKSNINTTVVVLLTSNKKLAMVPGNVSLKKGAGHLPKPSVVVVSQMATVDKERLLEKIGTLDAAILGHVLNGCQAVISASMVTANRYPSSTSV
ncbi:MAG: type II toxin-antitoxin system PemK/MazF family toxin [Deltaproteobacteria bacterium]|nr:type II toxin-antitoxin system PemK/MazF family toxin [Deltaproteobacteria bacterium]MCF8120681.1 type II toxin-antitoxin system PemK/MazF family toxin [Deltaproteobacteria bacterium]